MTDNLDKALDLRPSLQEFVIQQESVLKEHDPEKGDASWRKDAISDLENRLQEELDEYFNAKELGASRQQLMRELVDVANFTMMVYDVYRQQELSEIES